MSNKLLFVSIAFPPKNDPECIQAGRYAHYLNKLYNWDITVVTSKSPTLFMPLDSSLEWLAEDIKKIEIPLKESRIRNIILSKIAPQQLQLPDSKSSFHKKWQKVTKAYDKPDVIYSRSFPLSSTMMALKLKRHYQVPWILHLSDPWVLSPLHNMNSDFHKHYEKVCFEEADRISFTTQQTLNLYSEKYPKLRNKFFVNTHVYDAKSLSQKTIKSNNNKVKITYTGGLANTRTAETFLNALKRLIKINPKVADMLEITFAGDMDRKNRKLFSEFSDHAFIQHKGLISQNDSFKLQNKADYLIVIDSKIPDPKKNVFLPSKIIDYAAMGKSIIAITEKSSPSYEFIQKYGGASFTFDQEDELVDYLMKIAFDSDFTKSKKIIPSLYSIKEQVSILNEALKSLILHS